MDSYVYDIIRWDPINTDSFNLLAKCKIKADVKLLELFKSTPSKNILCTIHNTEKYSGKEIYGMIDTSTLQVGEYYITLDHIWLGYPEKQQGSIHFKKSALSDEEIIFTQIPNVVGVQSNANVMEPIAMQQASPVDTVPNPSVCINPRMKLSDIFIPIGISLIIIGLMNYMK